MSKLQVKPFAATYTYNILGLKRDVERVTSLAASNYKDVLLPMEDMKALLNDFMYKVNLSNKNDIVNAIKEGHIILLYAPTVRLPVWFGGTNDNPVTYVNTFGYFVPSKGSTAARYLPRQVFALCTMAYIMRYVRMDYDSVAITRDILKDFIACYVRSIIKVLDTLFGISLDKTRSAAISMLIGCFALKNLCAKDEINNNDLSLIYASVVATSPSGRSTTFEGVLEYIKGFDENAYQDFGTFIDALTPYLSSKGQLTGVKESVMRKCILMYGEKFIYGIENLPMFIGLVATSTMKGTIMKDVMLEAFFGREGVTLTAKALTRANATFRVKDKQ